VQPPRLRGESKGVFSTRAPHRPNPLGITLKPRLEWYKSLLLSSLELSGTKVFLRTRRVLRKCPPGQWLQCQANGSNVCRVLRQCTFPPKPETRNPKSKTTTPNPQPPTLNPKPQTRPVPPKPHRQPLAFQPLEFIRSRSRTSCTPRPVEGLVICCISLAPLSLASLSLSLSPRPQLDSAEPTRGWSVGSM